jgi:DHA3 family macrolide efflux protein-like MFS transporter
MTKQPLKQWRLNFALFLGSQFFSGLTSLIVQYSLIWYLTRESGSATIVSLSTLVGILPMALLSPFAGPLVDRFYKKKILIASDATVATFALVLFLSSFITGGKFPTWLIFIALFIRAVAQTFQFPTLSAIIPTIVPEGELTRVNGQFSMMQSANNIIAPALGAFLFSVIDIRWLILLDILGAIIGISLILFVKIPHLEFTTTEQLDVWNETREGFNILKANQGMFQLTIIGSFMSLVFMPAVSLYPLMTLSYFGGTVGQAGLIEVVWSVGMLLGGLLISIFGGTKNRIVPMIASCLLMGLTFTVSSFLPENGNGFIIFAICNFVAGLAAPYFNTLLMAMIQESFLPEQLGRVFGIMNALMSLAGPIGLIIAGPISDELGVNFAFLIAGIGLFITGLLSYVFPKVRHLDSQ